MNPKNRDKPQVTVFYRTCPLENTRVTRPSWYSKTLCLLSLLSSYSNAEINIDGKFIVLYDGGMKDNPEWADSLKRLVEPRGQIVEKPRKGNSASCFESICRGSELPKEEIVIFAEDDYLWLAPAIMNMVNALIDLPASYITSYDHPVRYLPDFPDGADYPHWHHDLYLSGERHWRSQESTCMTFATRAGTLKDDLPVFNKFKDNGKGSPNDRELFRYLQKLGPYRKITTGSKRRLLMGPLPSLSTHLHLPWLAPLIDWEKIAQQIPSQT